MPSHVFMSSTASMVLAQLDYGNAISHEFPLDLATVSSRFLEMLPPELWSPARAKEIMEHNAGPKEYPLAEGTAKEHADLPSVVFDIADRPSLETDFPP